MGLGLGLGWRKVVRFGSTRRHCGLPGLRCAASGLRSRCFVAWMQARSAKIRSGAQAPLFLILAIAPDCAASGLRSQCFGSLDGRRAEIRGALRKASAPAVCFSRPRNAAVPGRTRRSPPASNRPRVHRLACLPDAGRANHAARHIRHAAIKRRQPQRRGKAAHDGLADRAQGPRNALRAAADPHRAGPWPSAASNRSGPRKCPRNRRQSGIRSNQNAGSRSTAPYPCCCVGNGRCTLAGTARESGLHAGNSAAACR